MAGEETLRIKRTARPPLLLRARNPLPLSCLLQNKLGSTAAAGKETMKTDLIRRTLGRTGRRVTTLGLGGQASIQWPAPGLDPVAIVEKACRLGVDYLDTSNIYGPSQQHFGEAFRRLGLSPTSPDYDPTAWERIYVASKTHIRTARCPSGSVSAPTTAKGCWTVSRL